MERRYRQNVITTLAVSMCLFLTMGCQMEAKEPKPDNAVIKDVACKADEFSKYIGQHRSVLEGITLPPRTRVLRPGALVTMDYIESRLNIHLNGQGIIVKLKCG
ncbi:MAG: hypothetical protein COB84_05405 [Rhodobacteraceae bacterium]|nr:MAG: hypothetical protein COB84_05405 [Paracoccaceae bacterium]